MFWPDRGSGVPVEPARRPVASAVRQYFTEGGAGQAPTVPGGDWFNQITNELLNVLAAAGINPSKTDDDQLLQAIQALSSAGLKLEGVLEEAPGWDDIPAYKDGGLGGEMNAQAQALAGRTVAFSQSQGIPLATYAALRAYTGIGPVVYVGSRSNVFDGGHGAFFLDANNTNGLDDDGILLVDALGRRWKRQGITEVLPEWFGAKGDEFSDDIVAINKAISYAEKKTFDVYLSGTGYLVSTPIIVTTGSGVTIRGSNKARTRIIKTALTAPNVSRTYGGVVFNYNTPCIFAYIAEDESYVRHVKLCDISTTGLDNDITQTHVFAPRATYCVWENILSSAGKSFFEARLGGFVNTFINCRTALMSIHWDVSDGNAYSLYNTYANGTFSGSASEGYRFHNTNVNIHGGDTDGLNIGYLATGFTKMSLFGCNTESRLRQVNARDNASIDVHGGRYALTIIGSQVSKQAACFWAEGAGRINAYSVKAFKYDFTGGTPTDKSLAIASGSANVVINDVDLDITGNPSAGVFVETDIVSTSDGKVELLQAGKTINFVTNHRQATDFGFSCIKQMRKTLDFSASTEQTLLALSGADYNEIIIADISLLYRSLGSNGQGSVAGIAQLKITGSNRNTAKVSLQQFGSQLCPDGQAGTITFSASITGGTVAITATASSSTVAACQFLIDVKGGVYRVSGEADVIAVV